MIGPNTAVRVALLAIAGIFAMPALSQTVILPYAGTQYEHNNNVFYLPNSSAAGNGDTTLGDSNLKSTAGADFTYLWDRQRFYSTLEGRYIAYDHFNYLSHPEYLAKAGLDWKLLSAFDGTFLGSIERVMSPFAQRDTQTALAVNLDRHAIAKFNFLVAPEWRVETGVDYHDLDSPIQDFPDYGLNETTARAALKYSGFSNLTYGLAADYINGKYRNAPTPGTYSQKDVSVTMLYAATGLSAFNGAAGYTRRDQGQDQGSFSAPSFDLGYTRRLSGKSSIHAELTRAVNSYVGVGGSEEDTTASIQVNYQLTFKTGMSLGSQYVWSKFIAQTVPGSDLSGRTYHNPGATFKLSYQVLRWLLIQPYASYQRRTSTVPDFNYSSTIIGIEILAKKPAPPQAQIR